MVTDEKLYGKVLKWYVKFRFWYGRGGSHTELILSLLSRMAVIAIASKAYNFPTMLVWVMGFLSVIVITVIGYVDTTRGFASRELSFSNQYNKELQTLLERVE